MIVFLSLLIILILLKSYIKIDTSNDKPKEKYTRSGVKMIKEKAEKLDKEMRENLKYYEDIYTAIEKID